MTDEKRLAKNAAIKNTQKATKARHAGMRVRVYELKVSMNKLSAKKKESLDRMFLEAKWFTNAALAEGIFSFDSGAKSVAVLTPSGDEEREIRVLPAQAKQSLVSRLGANVLSLATRKENGGRVGRIKFRKSVNSIPLKQHGARGTYELRGMKVRIANVGVLRVRGADQIPENAEIAKGELVRRASGLYVLATVYEPWPEREPTGAVGGVDFGIKKNITFDSGEEVDISVPETALLKKRSRHMNRRLSKKANKLIEGGYTKKAAYREAAKSKGHKKRAALVERENEHIANKRKDAANKLVHKIREEYDIFAMQDEMIACWHKGLFGRQVQRSAIGRVKAMLWNSPQTIVVSRSFPSTQRCPMCGRDTKHPLEKRDYDCAYCGYHHDGRDTKSASMILMEALNPDSKFVVKKAAERGLGETTASVGSAPKGARVGIHTIPADKRSPGTPEAQGFSLG
jgi:putative transposase